MKKMYREHLLMNEPRTCILLEHDTFIQKILGCLKHADFSRYILKNKVYFKSCSKSY